MKILKSKKGIAIENALLFMMVIFSLCFLVSSFALIGHYQGEIENIKIAQRAELDQIGEYYIASENYTDFNTKINSEDYSGYICEVDDENNTLTVKVKVGGNVVLYVKKGADGNPIVWRYSSPN